MVPLLTLWYSYICLPLCIPQAASRGRPSDLLWRGLLFWVCAPIYFHAPAYLSCSHLQSSQRLTFFLGSEVFEICPPIVHPPLLPILTRGWGRETPLSFSRNERVGDKESMGGCSPAPCLSFSQLHLKFQNYPSFLHSWNPLLTLSLG